MGSGCLWVIKFGEYRSCFGHGGVSSLWLFMAFRPVIVGFVFKFWTR